MNISYEWLKELIDIPYTPEELSKIMTAQGMTVDGLKKVGMSYDNVVIGKLLEVAEHPQADKLHVCKVDVGDEVLQIVCGAPGIKVGDTVPVAKIGANFGDFKIKASKLRGVDSFGMCCAADELGISGDHESLLFLDSKFTAGTPFSTLLQGEDWIFELDIPGNRPDLLSHIGVAREIAARLSLTDEKYLNWQPRKPEYPVNDLESKDGVAVAVDDPELCPRYTARIIDNVKIGPSPLKMQFRLYHCGMRPINNVVDISNYVMLETGQPLHTFDYAKIATKKIVVRRAKEGEKFVTLDGEERTLDNEMLMITDGEKPVAIGGVMGGLDSGVTNSTETILLESAYFYGPNIRRTSRKLALQSEASGRYERCIRGTCEYASERAVELMTQFAGAVARKGVVDANNLGKSETISVSLKKCTGLLGMAIEEKEARKILTGLNYKLTPESGDLVSVTVPDYRVDVKVSADLSEDLARMLGYDSIPLDDSIPYYSQKPVPPNFLMRDKIRNILAGAGLREVLNPTLVSSELMKAAGAEVKKEDIIYLSNSATLDQSQVRTILYPGLIKNCQTNSAKGQQGVKLFELGRAYLNAPDGRSFTELERLSFALWGEAKEKTWSEKAREVDYTDGVTVLEILKERLGLPEMTFEAAAIPGLHPGRTAKVSLTYHGKMKELGFIGEMDPRVVRDLDLKGRLVVCELDLDVITETARQSYTYKKLPKFPASERDVSLMVPAETSNQDVVSVIRKAGGKLLTDVSVLDLYRDDKMAEGERSLTYRLTYRAEDRTLTIEEVDKAHQKVLEALTKANLTIR